MSDKLDDYRGRMVKIGKGSIIVPVDAPITDDDVVEVEETIDEIRRLAAPAKRAAQEAESLVKLLRKDCDKAIRERDDREHGEDAPLFNIGREIEAKSDDIKSRGIIRKLVRLSFVRGWQREIAVMAAEGQTLAETRAFLAKQLPEPLTTVVNRKELAIRGGKDIEPGIYSLKMEAIPGKFTSAKTWTPEVVGDDFVMAFRDAFKIPTPGIAELRAEKNENAKKRAKTA